MPDGCSRHGRTPARGERGREAARVGQPGYGAESVLAELRLRARPNRRARQWTGRRVSSPSLETRGENILS